MIEDQRFMHFMQSSRLATVTQLCDDEGERVNFDLPIDVVCLLFEAFKAGRISAFSDMRLT